MTHRTVPLDLLVRVRDDLSLFVEHYVALVKSGDAGFWEPEDEPQVKMARSKLAELTAQIEQQREGQGEPVAWLHESDDETFLTAKLHAYWSKQNDGAGILKRYSRPLYTAPQDSVPAWAWRQAFDEWKFDMNIPIAKGADWIESRALALAQTKG